MSGLRCKLTLPLITLFPNFTLCSEDPPCSTHLWHRAATEVFEISLYDTFSLSTYVFVQFLNYISMNSQIYYTWSYYIVTTLLYAYIPILLYFVAHNVLEVWPLGLPSVDLSSSQHFVFKHFLTFRHYNRLQLHPVYFPQQS